MTDITVSPGGPSDGDAVLLAGVEPVARTQWQLFRRRFFRHKLALLGLAILIPAVLVAVALIRRSAQVPSSSRIR